MDTRIDDLHDAVRVLKTMIPNLSNRVVRETFPLKNGKTISGQDGGTFSYVFFNTEGKNIATWLPSIVTRKAHFLDTSIHTPRDYDIDYLRNMPNSERLEYKQIITEETIPQHWLDED